VGERQMGLPLFLLIRQALKREGERSLVGKKEDEPGAGYLCKAMGY
jgi:hypothetical protein